MPEQYVIRKYNWQDVPTLRQMYYSSAQHQFAIGPFGSGKSSAMIGIILKFASNQKPSPDGIRRSRWAIVRNSYPQLKDTTIRTVKFWLPESIPGNVWKETDHNYFISSFPGIELELSFRALDRPDHVANLLSLELTGAWINEFREIGKDIYEALDGRVGRYPAKQDGGCSWYGILGDSNPPAKKSFWYRLFEEIRVKDPDVADKVKVWKQPSGLSSKAENLNNLPKNYYQNLAKGKDQLFVDVYIHGKYGYTREGKPVFESYNDNYHVAHYRLEPIPGLPVLMGWDFALNPTCVLGQLLRGQLMILDEVEGEGMGIERMSENILLPLLHLRYRGFQFAGMGDPTGSVRSPTDESTCYGVLKAKGFQNVKPAPTNALTPRLGAVNHFLSKNVGGGEPGLLISPHCSKLREAMAGGYCYKTVAGKNDEYTDEPTKNGFSHIADALQALCLYVTDNKDANKNTDRLKSMMQQQAGYRPADMVAGY
jgi:hypothetical protein